MAKAREGALCKGGKIKGGLEGGQRHTYGEGLVRGHYRRRNNTGGGILLVEEQYRRRNNTGGGTISAEE